MTVWKRDNVNHIHGLSGPGSGSNQGSARGFSALHINLRKGSYGNKFFTPRNYFRASIKLSCLQRVEAVILMNSDLCGAYVGQMLHILVFPRELQMTKENF